MYKLHIQEHPFKSDLTIHEIVSGTSLQQAYESLDLPLPIENARFVIEDEQITDYSIIPPDESVVCAKLVPSGENIMPVLGVLQMMVGVVLLAVPGAQWLGAGLILSGIGTICAYDYVSKMSFGDQESQSMRGGSGGTNTWNPVPVIFGEHLLAPDLAALDYTTLTESKDDSKADIYDLHQLYILGQKPVIVDKISIGDNLLFERKQVTCEGVLTVLSETRARLLHNTASVAAMVTAEMVTVAGKVTFEGFSRPQNNKEFTVVASTSSYIEFSTNNDVVAETANIKVGALVNSGVYAEVQAEIVTDGDFTDSPYDQIVNETTVNMEIKHGASVPTVFTTPGEVKSVDFRLSVPQGLYGLDGAKKEETSVSVSMHVKSITQDVWDYVDTYSFKKYKTSQNRDKEWSYEFSQRGQWMLMFKKVTKDLASDDGVNTVYLSTVISHKVDEEDNPYPPVSDLVKDDFTFLALKIRATDQLNGNITNLNCVLRQGNRVYDAASTAVNEYEKWVPGYSNNPASVYIDLLTNPIINRYPIGTAGWDSPEALPIDWAAMKDWYLFCEDIGYTCNGIVNSTSTVREELEKIANTGRATSILRDGLYGVSIDRVKMPVQLFTPRNTRDFSAQRSYNEPFDGVRIKFTDKNIGYQASEAVVFPQGSEKKKFDEVSVSYITDTANAKRYGGYYYNTKLVRQESFTFSTDFEYLVCTAGDRIKFQHDVPLVGIAASRISSLLLSGGSIIGIMIDEYVTLEAGKVYSVLIRAKDSTGAFVLREPLKVVAAPDIPTRALTFVTAQGDTSLFAQGDILAFGEYGQVTEDLMITDISCGDDITATITAVKYDESIYELESFPTWEPIVTDAGNSGRSAAIPTTSSRDMERMQIKTARNIGSTMYNEAQPTTPYREGDGWRRGISTYICTQTRSSSELFTASDWQLVTSDTFQSIAKDIFGEAFPEHRWFIHPDGDYPLLFSDLFIVNSGDTTKKYILENDENYWDAGQSTGKLLVPSVIGANDYTISNIKAKVGLAHTAYISGRYGRNGWMGESYTNIYPTATNEITLTAGTYVLQCYTGSIECSYGTALSSVPLVFTATAGTVTFTPVGVTYASLTKTDFVPPYYVGSAPVSSYTSAISSPTVTGVVDVYNRPERLLVFAELYADAQNCIALALFGENIRVIVTGQGVSSVNDIPISELVIADNTLPFSIAYESTTQFVEVILNGSEYTFNDSGVYSLFGDFDEIANVKHIEGYTSGTATYVYGDSIQLDLVPDTLYLGKDHSSTYYFNNQVHEVTYS